MNTNNKAITSKVIAGIHWDPQRKKQTVKKRCFYEKEPINQYKKQRYVENPTPQNMYQEVSAKP